LRYTKPGKVDRLLGDLSYPVFVLHFVWLNSLVLKLTQVHFFNSIPVRGQVALAIVVGLAGTLLISLPCLFVVVRPIDRLRSLYKLNRAGHVRIRGIF
jgi:peptidoglycan/LPS O-acetylase OafA/YrhL